MPVWPQLISLSRESNDWPITFCFFSEPFAVKHSMRVVLFALFSTIKITVIDTFFTNIAVLKCLHCCYVYLWSLYLCEHSHIKSQRLDRICSTTTGFLGVDFLCWCYFPSQHFMQLPVFIEIYAYFGTIVVIWTHVKPISADTSVDVQSKMHHFFVEVVSRHTKIIN